MDKTTIFEAQINNTMRHFYFFLIISIFCAFNIKAQTIKASDYPLLGAQVFIEPGQTEQETEQWFKTLHDNGMTICRIRMFESYMHKDNHWDFSLFDRAFRYAEKYNIKVLGTFFPLTDKTDIGGWKFPKDQAQLESFAEYIKQMSTHFKQYKSLYGWVLINEPGGGLKDNAFSQNMRKEWNLKHQESDFLKNGYPLLVDLQDEQFRNELTTWMLKWIANEVRKYDKNIHLHVNNHAIFTNIGEYNFSEWRPFLNSLGGSAHASWHFTMFPRQEYDIAMSADCELLYSGAGSLPWFMTEIQGGNNTFSGNCAMCPTKEEIAQWLWIIIGTEGKGGIFWSLNPRASGIESGEWALLDFQHQPTDRVSAIASVSHCLNNNKELFYTAKKIDPGISILYIRESLWTEKIITQGTPAATDGRKICMENMLGYFKSLSECGITPNLKAFDEYDFSKPDYSGQTIILAHQLAVPSKYVPLLESFVSKGGKLIVDGLTGFYDENVHNQMLTGFSLKKLFGGSISEFNKIDNPHFYHLKGYKYEIPGLLWKGTIRRETSLPLCNENNEPLPLATENHFGKGDVVWIPSLLGAGWSLGNYSLASWLALECETSSIPISFKHLNRDIIMKEMKAKDGIITITVNKSKETQIIDLQKNNQTLMPKILYADKGGSANATSITINPEESLVIHWK